MIKPNWDIFKAKFSENPQANFEWLCYLLFCKEFNKEWGIDQFINQVALETLPITDKGVVKGFQSKFYDSPLSNHKNEILKLLNNAKDFYKDITEIHFYTNRNWGQALKNPLKENKSKVQLEIEEHAEKLGIIIIWKQSGYFNGEFVAIKCQEICKYFFDTSNADEVLKAVENVPVKTALFLAETFNLTSFSSSSHIVDDRINELIFKLKSLRFFGCFQTTERSIELAEKIISGELAYGTPQVKALGLALAARYLCQSDKVDLAKTYCAKAKLSSNIAEIRIAESFIQAKESNVMDAISMLASDHTVASYSAIFMIKVNGENPNSGLDWLDNAGLTIDHLDIDAKIFYIRSLIIEKHWEKALTAAKSFDDTNLKGSPALLQLSAFSFLANSIKNRELRDVIISEIPLAADRFPLSDDMESLALRSKAISLFHQCSEVASSLGCKDIVDHSSNYALWLELRDPVKSVSAKTKLKEIFAVSSLDALQRLPLAHAFGIKLDYRKIEDEVNRQTALCIGGNSVLSAARFVLAINQSSPSKIVDYIALHRIQLEKFQELSSLRMLEIEALARSGLIPEAEKILDDLDKSGAEYEALKSMRSVIDFAKGADPIAESILLYEKDKKINDLIHLVHLLQDSAHKDKELHYALILFEETGTELDACRVAYLLSNFAKIPELHKFLIDNRDLVEIMLICTQN